MFPVDQHYKDQYNQSGMSPIQQKKTYRDLHIVEGCPLLQSKRILIEALSSLPNDSEFRVLTVASEQGARYTLRVFSTSYESNIMPLEVKSSYKIV